ncbi:tellurite resistance TerB family protein [Pseudothauera rhizosphaerae]|uniref:TerB family tellurite resistance protein n=1 Tax=Pseudothauera rhizosphaerae TaxID=2565932 RepID=A0A4S4AXJ0_9RHOO|nr:TerB family tellurite resistance protein [Pseudothauera rhizosphaerae]THF63322.1 TerB family tellurite resistance protein [Pseudothauera rhizosphaerae]
MLRTLKELFNALAEPSAAALPEQREHRLQLATAVLMVEVMRADAKASESERQAILDALRERFALAPDEVDGLYELARSTSHDAPDLHSFTSRLNKGYSAEEKVRIVEYLWQIAYADGHLSHHENHLMLKLGDLLYIPRGDFVAAKQRARAAAGLGAG